MMGQVVETKPSEVMGFVPSDHWVRLEGLGVYLSRQGKFLHAPQERREGRPRFPAAQSNPPALPVVPSGPKVRNPSLRSVFVSTTCPIITNTLFDPILAHDSHWLTRSTALIS